MRRVDDTASTRSPGRAASAGVVAALAVAAFSYVTIETLPIGLLSLLATEFDTSASAVGLLVTGYGLTVAAASVPLTKLTLGIPRRSLIIGLLAILVLATWVAAAAPNYWVLLIARLATALTQAVFWAVVAPTAAALFPPRMRGRVIAVTFAGASLATVLGVPAGTWIGQHAGWRMAFLAFSGLGLLTLAAITILLPGAGAAEGHAEYGAIPDRRRYGVVLTATVLASGGFFTTYTYIVIFVTRVSGFGEAAVSALLLVTGLGGLVGTVAIGALADRNSRAAMIVPVSLLTVALLALFVGGTNQVVVIALLALTGLALSGVPTAMQSRIMQVAPGGTAVASAGNSAAFNLGIAGGALIGGVLLPSFGVRSTPLVGALLAALALTVLLSEPLLASARRPPGRPHDPARMTPPA